jgi:prepilin-type N-terminal cleavage/methylation domain-containing protein
MWNTKEKGFTLVEMLVVVAIIGILATVVVINVSGSRQKANAVKATSAMSELSKAFEMAASEGCKTLTLDVSDNTIAILKCSDVTNNNQYATLPSPPSGIKYNVTIGDSTATADSATGNGKWGGAAISGISVNKDYTFEATGFDSGTYTCASAATGRSGCYCNPSTACVSVK